MEFFVCVFELAWRGTVEGIQDQRKTNGLAYEGDSMIVNEV